MKSDGYWNDFIEVQCPWCGEVFLITIDTSQGDHVAVEDCTVCCRPIEFSVSCEPGEVDTVEVGRG